MNFAKVIEKAKTRKGDTVKPFAFVVREPEKNQENLIKKLQDLGIEVVEVIELGHVAFAMQTILTETKSESQVNSVVVAGTDPELAVVLEDANYDGCDTFVISFGNFITKELAQTADDVKLINRSDILFQ